MRDYAREIIQWPKIFGDIGSGLLQHNFRRNGQQFEKGKTCCSCCFFFWSSAVSNFLFEVVWCGGGVCSSEFFDRASDFFFKRVPCWPFLTGNVSLGAIIQISFSNFLSCSYLQKLHFWYLFQCSVFRSAAL